MSCGEIGLSQHCLPELVDGGLMLSVRHEKTCEIVTREGASRVFFDRAL